MSPAVLEVVEQINETKAFLYCNKDLPQWVKEAGAARIKQLKTRVKILESYKG